MLRLLILCCLLCTWFTPNYSYAGNATIKTQTILSAVTATGASAAYQPLGSNRTFHIFGATTAGSGAASVTVQMSNDGTNWIVIDTLSLTLGTTITSDYFEYDKAWKYVRANVASISGTNGYVTLIMGADVQ